MDCRRCQEYLCDYIDREGSRATREGIEEHLAFCRNCQVLYRTTETVVRLVHNASRSAYELPEPAARRLQARLRSTLAARRGRPDVVGV